MIDHAVTRRLIGSERFAANPPVDAYGRDRIALVN
jgi:hypothetical protein